MPMPTPEQQQRARIFGSLFALTFVTSIAGLILYDPVLNDADYILRRGERRARRSACSSGRNARCSVRSGGGRST
jgi:hypothetical protein